MTPDMNSLIHQAQKLKEVKRLAQSGRMIDAIKLYREITNAGLKEAKDAVEAIARGGAVQINNVITSNVGGTTDQDEKMNEAMRFIKEGSKIEAIKAYREATGVGLKEAKDAVEAIERGEMTINIVQPPTPYITTPATPQAAAMTETRFLQENGFLRQPGTPTTPPAMETVSPLNGAVILFLLFVLLISGAAAFVWFISPELRGMILSFLK